MTSREQFEAWAKTTNSDLGRYKTGIHKGDFKNPVMRKMWLAWQASRQAVEIEIPERHYFCDNDGAFVDVSDVIYEIQHVGLKVKA